MLASGYRVHTYIHMQRYMYALDFLVTVVAGHFRSLLRSWRWLYWSYEKLNSKKLGFIDLLAEAIQSLLITT